jgi:hypothetical protein
MRSYQRLTIPPPERHFSLSVLFEQLCDLRGAMSSGTSR